MKIKVFIKTFGCQQNVAESDSLQSELKRIDGVNLDCDIADADYVICSACCVRKSAEDKAIGFLSNAKGLVKRHAKIVLTGCLASWHEREGDESFSLADYVFSNNDKDQIIDLIRARAAGIRHSCGHRASYSFRDSYHKDGDFVSYVPIQNGCDNFCAYCVVPLVRGREVSRDFDQVIGEIRSLDAAGVRIITLLGQNVNSYRSGSNTFCDLVRAIGAIRLKNVRRIYFDSPHIKDFSPDLIDAISSNRVFARHFHVPVQSFSTSVLRAMGRKETQDDIFAFFDRVKTSIPDATFSTDVMVGFPNESDEDFIMTLNGMRRLSFIDAFMYYYNPRKGTAAYIMQDLDASLKQERLEELIRLQAEISLDVRKRMLGQKVELIAIRPSAKDSGKNICYSESNCAVLVDKENLRCGEFGDFTLRELKGRTFLA